MFLARDDAGAGNPAKRWIAMLTMWLLFFFVAFGAKALLAVVMIFLVLDSERDCASCATETLPLQMTGWDRVMAVLSFGYVQRRWCPRCGWEGLTRTGRMNRAGAESSTGAPSLR
jgi:hypothetical protein